MSDVKQKCAEVFAKVMDVNVTTVDENSSPDNVENWDSLSHVELISGIEGQFGININPDEGIDIENFKTLVNFVEKKVQ